MTKHNLTSIEVFLSHIDEQDCWVWTAAKNKAGYPLWDRDGFCTAHRWSFWYFKSEIPEGMEIDHLCFNTSCVNPEHLDAKTPLANKRRRQRRSTVCINGHFKIIKFGRLVCVECQRKADREYRQRKRSRMY